MSIAKFKNYPVPASVKRELKNTFDLTLKPDGTRYARGKHGGIDVPPEKPGKLGDTVVAVQEGRVEQTGNVWGSAYGRQILVKHGHKHDGAWHYWYTFYAHLDRILVLDEQKVAAGQKIGRLGKSGSTFGSHVHFELHTTPRWVDGLVNPFSRLEAARKAEL